MCCSVCMWRSEGLISDLCLETKVSRSIYMQIMRISALAATCRTLPSYPATPAGTGPSQATPAGTGRYCRGHRSDSPQTEIDRPSTNTFI